MNNPIIRDSAFMSALTLFLISPVGLGAPNLAPNLTFQSYQPTTSLESGKPLIEPPMIKSRGGKLKASMRMVSAGISDRPIIYGGSDLFSSQTPFSNASQPSGSQAFTSAYAYQIRAYGKDYPASFPSPILQVARGAELDLEITDDLSMGIGQSSGSLFETNFHGHGLHVSPLSMGDNIYPIIQDPGTVSSPQAMRVRIPIPSNQESGLNWFHPHRHMQTHPQVYGGLAGFLVIGDPMDPWPQYKANGAHPLKQRYLHFSEVNIQKTDPSGKTITENGVNRLLVYGGFPGKGGSTTPQPTSYWQKRVNGQLNPVITFRPGETQIFNMGAIGAFGSFNIAVTDGQLAHPWVSTLLDYDGDSSDQSKEQGIDIKPLPLVLDADDRRMQDLGSPTLLMPGNRLTMALTAPKTPGTYYLIDGWGGCNGPMTFVPSTSKSLCVDSTAGSTPQSSYTILATLEVQGSEVRGPEPTFPIKGGNYDLFATPPTHEATYAFSFDNQGPTNFLVNNFTFPNGPLTQIQIGSIEEWSLYNQDVGNGAANHPFHIHQGNFIVTEINGKKVDPDQVFNPPELARNYISPRDNVNLPSTLIPTAPNAPFTSPSTLTPTMKIKFQVADFPGKYVFHCHILKHEDQGMMVSVLAFGPVDGLRSAFGGSAKNGTGILNVINGRGTITDVRQPFGPKFTGGLSTASGLGAAKYYSQYVVGQSQGGSEVVLYDGKKKNPVVRFKAFPSKVPGVSVALGDINGDAQPEIIVGSRAPGPARVRIFNTAGRMIREYGEFSGDLAGDFPNGVNVASGDVDGDNFDDIVIGAGAGRSPIVVGLSGRDITAKKAPQTVLSFTAGGDPTSGVRVAVGYVHPLTVPSYLPNVVTTPESGSTSGKIEVWNPASLVPVSASASAMNDHQMMGHSLVAVSSALLDTYSAFEGKTDPVQLGTGYVGTPGVPRIFAWSSPDQVSERSYNYTPPTLSSTPCAKTNTSPCPVINVLGTAASQMQYLSF